MGKAERVSDMVTRNKSSSGAFIAEWISWRLNIEDGDPQIAALINRPP